MRCATTAGREACVLNLGCLLYLPIPPSPILPFPSLPEPDHQTLAPPGCEPSASAQQAYCNMVYNGSTRARKFYAGCTPGYYNNEGASAASIYLILSWIAL
jgi:hypothetical protein